MYRVLNRRPVHHRLASIETPSFEKYGLPLPVDSSKLKVSIEYGLCEMLNKQAIRENVNPKDGNWGFDIAELKPKFPEGMVDRTVERVYKEVKKNRIFPQRGKKK